MMTEPELIKSEQILRPWYGLGHRFTVDQSEDSLVATVAHELGHILHLSPEEQDLVRRGDQSAYLLLGQTEVHARAVCWLVFQMLGNQSAARDWLEELGLSPITGADVRIQAAKAKTIDIACQVVQVLVEAGVVG